MRDFLYVFGFESPNQKKNNQRFRWEDENSCCVLMGARDAAAALAWGDRIAQRFVALLHDENEVDWAAEGYASFIDDGKPPADCPHVREDEYPDFCDWLKRSQD